MKVFSEYFILFTILFATGISTILCIIGLSTPGWRFDTYRSLFCDQCPKIPNVLAIISMVLLIICLILLGLLIAGFIDQQQVIFMRFIIPSLLLISSIFLFATLTSYLSFVDPNHGYSYKLTIMAFLFAYLASLFAAFWFGSCGFISKTYSLEKIVEDR